MATTEEQTGRSPASEDYRHRFELAAAIGVVYEALTTQRGICGWWAADAGRPGAVDADVATEVGGVTRVRFSGGGWTDLRIDRLERPHRIEWACVAQSIAGFTPNDEWVGTTISFELTETDGGTRLDFTHHGLRSLDCIDVCEPGWQFHIGQSLKALVEAGG